MMFDALRKMAMVLAPELGASPFYIVPDPFAMSYPDGARAYVMRGKCTPLEKYLVDSGQWLGPGPVIVFVNRNLSREETILVLLHELAHCLTYRPLTPSVDLVPGAGDNEQIAALQSWCANPEPAEAGKPQWVIGDHGKNFTRIALHLWWRAALIG